MKSKTPQPIGARIIGKYSGRPFDSAKIGIPIRFLSSGNILIAHHAIDIVEKHLRRFAKVFELPELIMIKRLRQIADEKRKATKNDVNFYAHELREFVRYRKLGFENGRGDDFELWNNLHTATLEDYRLREKDDNGEYLLYHKSASKFFPKD